MAKILLDYVFPITVITPIPAASTGFLKRACLVCKPTAGQEGNVGQIFTCNTMAEVAARTDNENAQQLFNAGLSQVFILLADDLDLAEALADVKDFYTLLISDDFDDDDIFGVKASYVHDDITYEAVEKSALGNGITIALLDTVTAGAETVQVTDKDIVINIQSGVSTATQVKAAIDNSPEALALITANITGTAGDPQTALAEQALQGGSDPLDKGSFDGVTGIATQDDQLAAQFAAVEKQSAFLTSPANGAGNMCFAFGSLLSNPANWLNQQYISMPFNDGIDTLGEANALFDDKVSFVINDDEFANRLALFAAGGAAIIAPYIIKNLSIDLQSRALQWIAANQPQYTIREATLLEARLLEDVVNVFIARNWIEAGTVSIALDQGNFVGTGAINVSEPKALWRIFSELRQTL